MRGNSTIKRGSKTESTSVSMRSCTQLTTVKRNPVYSHRDGVWSQSGWLGEVRTLSHFNLLYYFIAAARGTDRNQWKFCWSDTGNRMQEDASYITKFTCWKNCQFHVNCVCMCMYPCGCVCVCACARAHAYYTMKLRISKGSSELFLGRCISA